LKPLEINWKLGIDENMLPKQLQKEGKSTFRSLKIDGEEFDFSDGLLIFIHVLMNSA
jgi:UDP-N-acetyl-2-amino-2-deoxyglucuronate dehydrogenase